MCVGPNSTSTLAIEVIHVFEVINIGNRHDTTVASLACEAWLALMLVTRTRWKALASKHVLQVVEHLVFGDSSPSPSRVCKMVTYIRISLDKGSLKSIARILTYLCLLSLCCSGKSAWYLTVYQAKRRCSQQADYSAQHQHSSD